MTILDINVETHGEKLVVALGEIFALERSLARSSVDSLGDYEDAIRRGLERLLGGF